MKQLPSEATTPPCTLASAVARLGFETIDSCELEKERRIRSLQKVLNQTPAHQKRYKRIARLMAQLAGCRKGERCGGSACPVCRRNDRKKCISSLVAEYDDPDAASRLSFVTLLRQEWEFPAGKLHLCKPRTITDRLRKQLQRMEFRRPIFGGVDLSFDPDRKVWMVHLHLVVDGLTKEVEGKLRQLYPASEHIRKPVVVKSVDYTYGAFSYAIKSFPNCRPSYTDKQGRANTPGKRRRVPEPHHTEFLLWVARFPIGDLKMVRGWKLVDGTISRRSLAEHDQP